MEGRLHHPKSATPGKSARLRAGLAGLGLLLGLSLSACKQGENERCQIDDDCAEGYYCELSGNARSMGGYCKSTTSTAIQDLAPRVD